LKGAGYALVDLGYPAVGKRGRHKRHDFTITKVLIAIKEFNRVRMNKFPPIVLPIQLFQSVFHVCMYREETGFSRPLLAVA
jgi:hypothetical protein